MAQSDKDWLKGAYKKAFGEDREANFDAKGGAQYWLDQMKSNPTSHSRDEVLRMLQGSDEGKKYAASGVTMPGGVDPTKSIYSQFKNDPGNTWLQHWAPGGSLAEDNVDDTFSAVNKSLTEINPTSSYFNFDDTTFNMHAIFALFSGQVHTFKTRVSMVKTHLFSLSTKSQGPVTCKGKQKC